VLLLLTQLSEVVSQLFAVPSPTQVSVMGGAGGGTVCGVVGVTMTRAVWREEPLLSVIVKVKLARPVKFSVGTNKAVWPLASREMLPLVALPTA
jgi:hypothetical protein